MNSLPLRAIVALLALATCAAAADGPPADPLDAYNVVWDSPSKDSSGSMPLGNGDIGLNVWAEAGGDLVFYVSKTDAWDGLGRLLKLGRVRVKLTPNPFTAGQPFRQTLRLRQGEIEIVAGQAADAVTVRLWADANRPVIHVEAYGQKPFELQATLEVWRTKEGPLEGKNRDSARGVLESPEPLVATPDTLLDLPGDRLVWYHRNTTSCWPVTMKVQGLEGLVKPSDDPLMGRTFGGMIKGEGLAKTGPASLKSKAASKHHAFAIYALTKTPATEAQWLSELDATAARAGAVALDKAREAHRAWWNDFWNRSWIRVIGTAGAEEVATNTLPLRIGASSSGGNRFAGDIAQPMIFSRALTEDEIAMLAARNPGAPGLRGDPALVAAWDFGSLKDGVVAGTGTAAAPAKVVGEVGVADTHARGSDPPAMPGALRLTGKGYLEVADSPKLRLAGACTISAWVAPAKGTATDGRLFDKCPIGTNNGFVLDTYPGGRSLRFITPAATLTQKDALKVGEWTHVAAVFDPSGDARLYVGGKPVTAQTVGTGTRTTIAQGYALQRFINACGGRGAMPIKFNGSIFTVDIPAADGDYRRWGGCFWFQNTRLPYWSMAACGDFDLMQPLFRMYLDTLPLRKAVTRLYYNHDGAFYPETMYFWGTPCNDDYRWKRDGVPAPVLNNQYIMRYWQGGIELVMMMLDTFDYTGDKAMARDVLVPFAGAIVTFYDKHYPRDTGGKIRFEPAQSLETWWQATNPMPEVAGLRAVLPRLIALPENLASDAQRREWRRLLGELPPVPLRQVDLPATATASADGKTLLSPAQVYAGRHNCENPELYAIFPYRLYGVGREALEMARASFAARDVKGSAGWQQDPVQAAMLGLADAAARLVAHRFATKDRGSRFPAFWGPNFDWIPDQDHGSNGMMGLQAMVLQFDGRKIYVLPAWPKKWDVEFKLHAPYGTTVEGVYRGGKLESLRVTPESRMKDVVRCEPE
jgi:hypothetical protein